MNRETVGRIFPKFHKISGLALLLAPLLLFGEFKELTFSRKDDSLIQYYLSTPDKVDTGTLVIFVSGSWTRSAYFNHITLAKLLNPHGVSVLTSEKRGATRTKFDEIIFHDYDCLDERLNDFNTLLSQLKWEGKVILLGESEGGKLVPLLTLKHPQKVDGTILFGAGGGLTFKEEMEYQLPNLIAESNFLYRVANKIRQALNPNEIEEKFDEMVTHPTTNEFFKTHTHKWWASFLTYHPLPDILKLETPLLILHGAEDLNVPVNSSDLVVEKFREAGKQNLTYLRYENLGHSLIGRTIVNADLISWILNQSKSRCFPAAVKEHLENPENL